VIKLIAAIFKLSSHYFCIANSLWAPLCNFDNPVAMVTTSRSLLWCLLESKELKTLGKDNNLLLTTREAQVDKKRKRELLHKIRHDRTQNAQISCSSPWD
jgi:hypothetical protein